MPAPPTIRRLAGVTFSGTTRRSTPSAEGTKWTSRRARPAHRLLESTSMKSIPTSLVERDSAARRSRRKVRSRSGERAIIGGLPDELLDAGFLRPARVVAHRHPQRLVLAVHFDRLDLDEVPQPLLQRAGHERLRRRVDRLVRGGERHAQQAAAEVRPVDPFARRCEQHLLDHVADVAVGRRVRLAAAPGHVEGEGELHGYAPPATGALPPKAAPFPPSSRGAGATRDLDRATRRQRWWSPPQPRFLAPLETTDAVRPLIRSSPLSRAACRRSAARLRPS